MCYYFALFLFLLTIAAAILSPPGRPIRRRIRRLCSLFARHPAAAIFATAFLSLIASAAISLFCYFPQPTIVDEFSYLLAADTFAHGRLTNPTHPMWQHFESFYIIHHPTYMSKYPPGQGLILALGQLLWHPILGAWLSIALACAALVWMFLAFLPPRWALLGGLLAVLTPLLTLWSQNYFGGGLALTGAALLLGAMRRIIKHPQARHSFILGAGVGILALTRPYEGLVLTLIVFVVLLVFIIRTKPGPAVLLGKLALPAAATTFAALSFLAYYNYRVTGSPFKLPYLVHEQTYAVAPLFAWQKPYPQPTYNHPVMRDFHTGDPMLIYQRYHTWRGFCQSFRGHVLLMFVAFYAPGPLAIALLALPCMLRRDPWMRLILLMGLVCILGNLLAIVFLPGYAAPGIPLLFLLTVVGLRYIRTIRLKSIRVGSALVLVVLVAGIWGYIIRWWDYWPTAPRPPWVATRTQAIHHMQEAGGKYLVIVSYGPEHLSHNEWVYNAADIDGSQIVWARDMGVQKNKDLIDYFKGRKVLRICPTVP